MIGFVLVLLGIPLSSWFIGEYLKALEKCDKCMLVKSLYKIAYLVVYFFFAGMCSL